MSVQAELERLRAAKELLRVNLQGKGVSVPEDASINDMAALVATICCCSGTTAATLGVAKIGSMILGKE